MKKQKKFITLEQLKHNSKIKSYKPNINKIKAGFVLGFIVLLLITPCTNWLLIPLYKILNKFPLWLYR